MCPSDPSSGTVFDSLRKKHPQSQPVDPGAILSDSVSDTHPILYDGIDGQIVRKAALRLSRAAGPSGVDSIQLRRLCVSFGLRSEDLCNSLAAVARRLCVSYVDPTCLSSFLSDRLIALDKCPGVCPIGIGETPRRLICKTVLWYLRGDIINSVGPLQTCAGRVGGCEASVHAMRSAFESSEVDALLLVDASNAFNSLNRDVAMRNILTICPAFARIIINTYCADTNLFIGGQTVFSSEGTTQGDPLAMSMYALATVPLIHRLSSSVIQSWYADDATAAGRLQASREWWDNLVEAGPSFGYFPNSVKTWLLVKPNSAEEANAIFEGTNISITTEGRPILGSPIGTPDYINRYVESQVSDWNCELRSLRLQHPTLMLPLLHTLMDLSTNGHICVELARTLLLY